MIFLLVLQQVEGNLIYPRVVGSSVGLPPIWVLAAVTVGGSLWGIAGMLFAVPVCSILHALLRLGVHRRLEAQAAAGASVPAPTPEEKECALNQKSAVPPERRFFLAYILQEWYTITHRRPVRAGVLE